MKRRHFLKLLAAIPFIGLAVAKATEKSEQGYVLAPYHPIYQSTPETTLKRKGELTVLVGFPKTGKTTLAKEMCRMTSGSGKAYLIDDADSFTDPYSDVNYLLRRGIDVLAVIQPPPNYLSKDVFEALAKSEHLDFASASSVRLMLYQASRVILIKGFKWQLDDAKNPKNVDFTWTCRSLKNRYAPVGDDWQWHASLPFKRLA